MIKPLRIIRNRIYEVRIDNLIIEVIAIRPAGGLMFLCEIYTHHAPAMIGKHIIAPVVNLIEMEPSDTPSDWKWGMWAPKDLNTAF